VIGQCVACNNIEDMSLRFPNRLLFPTEYSDRIMPPTSIPKITYQVVRISSKN